MRFALMIEAQQGLSYADQLAIVLRAERAGFEAFFRSDHYRSFPGRSAQPTTDAWTVLAGLARETTRIGLGVLVSPVTFRHPGSFAKVVTTVDEMSGGRIEVGVGAGWNEAEHLEHGLAFPPIDERAGRLEDELEMLHGFWAEPDGWSFDGQHYRVRDAAFHPKPVARPGRPAGSNGTVRPRIIVGGTAPRSLRMAVRWADELNLSSVDAAEAAAVLSRLDEACTAAGRDPASITRSAMVGVLVGRDPADLRRREAALVDAVGAEDASDAWLAARRPRWIYGTPDEARAAVERFAAAGVERIMLQDFLPHDLDMIDLLAEELVRYSAAADAAR